MASANIPIYTAGIKFFQVFHPLLTFKNTGATDATIDTLIIGIKTYPDIFFAPNGWPVIYDNSTSTTLGPSEQITPIWELDVPKNIPKLLDSLIFKIRLSYHNIDGGKKDKVLYYKYHFTFDFWSTPDYSHTPLDRQRFDWTNSLLFGH